MNDVNITESKISYHLLDAAIKVATLVEELYHQQKPMLYMPPTFLPIFSNKIRYKISNLTFIYNFFTLSVLQIDNENWKMKVNKVNDSNAQNLKFKSAGHKVMIMNRYERRRFSKNVRILRHFFSNFHDFNTRPSTKLIPQLFKEK